MVSGLFSALHDRSEAATRPPISRGSIVRKFLQTHIHPADYAKQLQETDDATAAYNLVFGNLLHGSLWLHTNVGTANRTMEFGAGLHAVTNGPVVDVWPKMRRGVGLLKPMMTQYGPQGGHQESVRDFFSVLQDPQKCQHHEVPDTVKGLNFEYETSAIFVHNTPVAVRNDSSQRDDGRNKVPDSLTLSRDGRLMWHERTRVDGVDGTKWTMAQYAIPLPDQAVPYGGAFTL